MDIVVTVPKTFTYPTAPGKVGLAAWIAEGDPAGEPESGEMWWFTCGGGEPDIDPGDRVYVVCEYKLRGYAPLVNLMVADGGRVAFWRRGGAVAVTIPDRIVGFRGWRYRWWEREQEVPFPDWRTP